MTLTEEGAALFSRLCAGRAGNEPLLRRDNGQPFRKSDQEYPMRHARQRAKITPRVSFHILRHTWASLSVMAGMPLMVVAHNLGHANTRMVEKHYGHLSPSFIDDEIRKGAPRFGLTASNVKAFR